MIKRALTSKFEPLPETKSGIIFQRKKSILPLIEAFKLKVTS